MKPDYDGGGITVHHGDSLDVLAGLPDASVDAVVTDPPYGLGFMGKDWDDLPPGLPFARQCLRVLKPGGHLLAFGGTRTWHRLAVAVEDAGFEIRDSIAWMYGSGFPKSLDVSKAIDKRAEVNEETKRRIALVAEVIRSHREAKGMERAAVSLAVVGTPSGACWNWEHQQLPSIEVWPAIKATLDIPDEFDGLIEGDRAQFIAAERAVVGRRTTGIGTGKGAVAYIADSENRDLTAPATLDAERWQGWGTALKPAWESVVVGRKPPALWDRIGSHLDALEGECRRLANGAARSSGPTRHDSPEATTATARASAATPPEGDLARTTPTGSGGGSSETTATSWSGWRATTCSNIVTSWKRSLAVVSQPTSTFTTATTSETTTDLTTLWSSLSQITEPSTLLSETSPDGLSSLAHIVDDLFGAALLNWRATRTLTVTEPATSATPPDFQGGGAQLSPIVVARKPLAGTVAANVLAHGTGALNIDGTRIGVEPWVSGGSLCSSCAERAASRPRLGTPATKGSTATSGAAPTMSARGTASQPDTSKTVTGCSGGTSADATSSSSSTGESGKKSTGQSLTDSSSTTETTIHSTTGSRICNSCREPITTPITTKERGAGRWPSNVILDESQSAALDEQSGTLTSGKMQPTHTTAGVNGRASAYGADAAGGFTTMETYGDSGGASRFFYTSKADAAERPKVNGTAHPTVKPLSLMQWLVRLVTPPGGVVLEPFAGSGTTVEACIVEGFDCIAIEREADYLPLIEARITRRRDPARAVELSGEDMGLFDLLDEEPA